MAARIVADRYELADRLGSGGGGVVWRAHDTSLDRTVAIKEIELAHHLPDDDRERLQARALREARAAAQLEHPNVVNVYDVQHTDDAIFLIMEFVDAPSLQDLVATEGRLTPQRAAEIGLDVAAALLAAHAAGIVHRDIKPSNVLVGAQGALVTDFGIATVIDDPSLTATGQAVGTPDVVSPEQVTETPVGPATDVWSLGATLYHALEGQSPFRRDGSLATVNAVVNDPPHAMTHAGPLAAVVKAMLTKDPAQRPSLEEVRSRLEAVVNGPGVEDTTAAMAPIAGDTVSFTAPQPVPTPLPAAAPQPSPPEQATQIPPRRTVREPRPERSRTGAWAAVAIGLLLLVVVAALLLTSQDDTTPTDTGTEPTVAPTEQETAPPPSPDPTTAPTTPEQTDSPEPSPEPTATTTSEPAPTDSPTEPTVTDEPTVTPTQ